MAFMAVFAAAAAAMKVVGSVYEGESKASQFNQAGDIAEQNARNTRLQTSAQEDTQRRQQAVHMGNIRASAAESGFDSSTGSLATLQAKNAGEMELDALTTRYNGTLKALSFDNEARAMRANAKTARTTGVLNAFGSMFSSAASYGGGAKMGG